MPLYRRIDLGDGHVKYDPVDDEIERLRAALTKIRDALSTTSQGRGTETFHTANEALKSE
jgi:hypothetical protein